MIINRKNKIQVEMKNDWFISDDEHQQPLIYEGFPTLQARYKKYQKAKNTKKVRSLQEDEQSLIYEGFPMETDNGYFPSYDKCPPYMRDTKNTKKKV